MTPKQRKTLMIRCGEWFRRTYSTQVEAMDIADKVNSILEKEYRGTYCSVQSTPMGFILLLSNSEFGKV